MSVRRNSTLLRLEHLAEVARRTGCVAALDLPLDEALERLKLPPGSLSALKLCIDDGFATTMADLGKPSVSAQLLLQAGPEAEAYVCAVVAAALPDLARPVSPSRRAGPLHTGMSMEALRRWAMIHGALDLLELPALRFAADPTASSRIYLERYTLAEIVTEGHELMRWVVGRATIQGAIDGCLDALRQRSGDVAEGAAESKVRAAQRTPPVEGPLLQAWQAAMVLREQLGSAIPPSPVAQRPTTLEIQADPVAIGLLDDRRGRHGCRNAARVWLTRRSDGPFSLSCECPPNLSRRCRAKVDALETFLDVLGGLDHSGSDDLRARLGAQLERPDWDRQLAQLAEATAAGMDAPVLVNGAPARLVWQVKERLGTGVLVEPALARQRKTGSGFVLRKAKWPEARAAAFESPLPVDIQVLDLLAAVHEIQRRSGHSDNALTLLRRVGTLLVDHPDVWTNRGKQRVTVRTVVVTLRAVRDGERIALRPALNGVPLASEEASRLHFDLQYTGWRWRPAEGELLVLQASNRVRRVLRRLEAEAVILPVAAAPHLARQLAPLANHGELAMDAAVRGEETGANPEPQVTLATLPGGLKVTLSVRPVPGGASAEPGEGAQTWYGQRGDEPLWAARDLEVELALAATCWQDLGLPDRRHAASVEARYTVLLSDPDAALDVVDQARLLTERPHGKVAVLWDTEAVRVVGAADLEQLKIKVSSDRNWFGVAAEVEVVGRTIRLDHLLAAIADRRRYVEVDGSRWVELQGRLRRRLTILADAAAKGRLSPLAAPALLAMQDEGAQIEGPPNWLQLADRIRAAETMVAAVPEGLGAELRLYQLDGFRWLARLATWAPGAVLADDMGLGKTVQALALMLARQSLGPTLVVAPTSVGFNWQREAERFAPELRILRLRGKNEFSVLDGLQAGDVLVTSWDLAARHVARLQERRWSTMIMDEAQAIKNPGTRRAKAIFSLEADFRLALTGTPLENRTNELWSVMTAAVPGLLGTAREFHYRFAQPIERDHDQRASASLAALVSPFVLRRLKRDVAADLPSRTDVRLDVELGSAQRKAYETLRRSVLVALKDPSQRRDSKARFQTLAALTRLRQLACDPRLCDPESQASSAKLEALRGLLADLREGGHRALVFSQFTSLLDLVRPELESDGFRCLQLDGRTSANKRKLLIDGFQDGQADVFLLSVKAGGVGVNLTAATYVIHLDPWWNPAVEDQATDRAHRIGQDRPVTVYRLVARNTVEESIYSLHGDKRALMDALLAGSGSAAALSPDELRRLIEDDQG